MSKPPHLPDHVAFNSLVEAYNAERLLFFTDPKVLNRPGSPVYSPLDVFVPTMVLLVSSLTLLFAFGMIEWMLSLLLVLAYQLAVARRLVEWRMHRRTSHAFFRNLHNLKILWDKGGVAIALKDFPEKNCIAPRGDWQEFVAEWLLAEAASDAPPTDLTPPVLPAES